MQPEDVQPSSPSPTGERLPEELNLFGRILSAILGSDDPEKQKRRQLKLIARDLKRSKLRFYNPRGDQALPNLARFFLEIYKVVGPAQALLQNSDASNVLKSILIESFLTPQQLELMKSFSEEAIREKAKSFDTKDLAAEIKESIVSFFSAFDSFMVKSINQAYTALLTFTAFVRFDYYFLLKKFDSSLRENDFAASPKFESINGEYIADDLKDFLEVALPVSREHDWERFFDVLIQYRGVDPVSRPAWRKLLGTLENVKRQMVLEQIVRYADKNPNYRPAVQASAEKIVEPYLSKIKTQSELAIQKILQEKRNQKIDKLCHLVFGTAAVARMKNYTERANLTFSKKTLAGFLHTAATNYLKAFLIDYVKKDVREMRDLLVVRGKWSTNILSLQLSEHFHQIMLLSDSLLLFDDACADEGEYGQRLRKFVIRADKDPASMKNLKDVIKDINDKAMSLVSESAQNLISFGRSLKNLIDDYDKAPSHEILINWKEVDGAAGGRIRERMVEIYKKIYSFIQLLQFFVKK